MELTLTACGLIIPVHSSQNLEKSAYADPVEIVIKTLYLRTMRFVQIV